MSTQPNGSPSSPSTSNTPRFKRFTGTTNYIASPALVDAVNCALALERPLLVKGEPGTGKTLLARHVAEGLGLPLDSWHIKSTSKADDGLYVYDTVQRLNDARFGDGNVRDIRSYIRLGPLGRVFSAKNRQVLLIDEIDKADLEFPNDILREIDEMRFTVLETGDEIEAVERPMVIITSNNEKELPDAFLRRCVFHFIDFPDVAQMREIVAVHHPRRREDAARAGAAQVLLAPRPEGAAQAALDLGADRLDHGARPRRDRARAARGRDPLPGGAAQERAGYPCDRELRRARRQDAEGLFRARRASTLVGGR